MKLLIFGIVLVCIVVIIAVTSGDKKNSSNTGASSKSSTIADRTKVTTEAKVFTGIMDREVKEIYIAGLAHHCDKRDVGFFSGVVFPETDNPYDNKAMAIGSHIHKKIIGYVPAAILDEYRAWCKREKRICAGFIFWDGEHLRGRARVYTAEYSDSRIQDDLFKYADLVAEHYGWELNPDGSLK